MRPKTILLTAIGIILPIILIIDNRDSFVGLLVSIPFALIVFYVMALILGMKPLGRYRTDSQIFGRLLTQIDPANNPSGNADAPPPTLAAMIFMALILVTIFGLAFIAIAQAFIALFN